MRLSSLLGHDHEVTGLHHGGLETVARLAVVAELKPGHLAFIKNNKFLQQLDQRLATENLRGAGVIIDAKLWFKLTPELQNKYKEALGYIGLSPNVPLTMARLSAPLHRELFGPFQNSVDGRQMGTTDIDPTALIAQGAFIGEFVKLAANVIIHPGAVIHPKVEIGEGTEVFANVVIYPFTKIGKRVRIHANTTIGADGFGYVFHQGQHKKIWQMGGVDIHDDVEIGSNSSVDMGAFTATVIGAGTRIDNQVQIGHNAKIGKHCVLCGQAGVAGSAVLEDFVVLGGRVAVGPDAHLGQGVQAAGGAMVNEGAHWPAGSVVAGHPARDIKEWMKSFAWVRKNALGEKS